MRRSARPVVPLTARGALFWGAFPAHTSLQRREVQRLAEEILAGRHARPLCLLAPQIRPSSGRADKGKGKGKPGRLFEWDPFHGERKAAVLEREREAAARERGVVVREDMCQVRQADGTTAVVRRRRLRKRKKKKKDVDVVPVYSRREAARDRARREDEEARAAEGLAVPTPRRRTRKAVNYADGESYASGRVLSARYQHLTSKHQDAHESLFAPRK